MESRAGGLRAHSPSGRHPRPRPKSPHTLRAGAETKADPPRTLRARGEIIAESPPTLRAGAETKADSPRTLRASGETILHVRFGRVGKP